MIMRLVSLCIISSTDLFGGTASQDEALFFERNFLELTSYSDLQPTDILPNEDVLYHRAFRLKGADFEIRIRYEPMKKALEAYAKSLEPNSGTVMAPPNNMFQMTFMVCLMNILQTENEPRITAFPSRAVKEEFNADAGLTSFGKGKSQFLGKYSAVLAYGIHKQDIGDVYVYYLFNDVKKGAALYRKYFYPVKFK